MKCLFCILPFTPYKFGDGRQKFCSKSCQYKYWIRNNSVRAKEIRKKTKAKHRERIKESARLYYLKNREKILAYGRLWSRKNKEKVVQRALLRKYRVRGAKGKHTLEEWEELKKRFHYKCSHCKKKVKLTRDHIIPITKGGTNDIDNIQPLCQPCNSRKFNHV